MEMVFRKIDYWIEGDHRRSSAGWTVCRGTARRLLRKGAEIRDLRRALVPHRQHPARVGHRDRGSGPPRHANRPAHHLGRSARCWVFSALFYWIFSWFREQACILVCPYGRLQGVLLDRNSIVIAYDHVRGEPRGKLRRDRRSARKGTALTATSAWRSVPTGIDIRNGTQLECVNCTACIDACDTVMDTVKKPRGLVRYASAERIADRRGFRWTARVIGYTVVLLLLAAVLTYLLAERTELDVTVLRTPGMFYQEQPDGRISNVYDLKVLNKTFGAADVGVRLLHPAGRGAGHRGSTCTLDRRGSGKGNCWCCSRRIAARDVHTARPRHLS